MQRLPIDHNQKLKKLKKILGQKNVGHMLLIIIPKFEGFITFFISLYHWYMHHSDNRFENCNLFSIMISTSVFPIG